MFKNPRRTSYDNSISGSEAPIVVSSLITNLPPVQSERQARYDKQYATLRKEFFSATQTRQNTATLTDNYSPIKRTQKMKRKPIVFHEYEAQKQCLYVRPKGLLQVDPSRFQITPSELTMLRGRHYVALTQVDISTATGEVKRLEVPPSPIRETSSRSSLRNCSVTLPGSRCSSPAVAFDDESNTTCGSSRLNSAKNHDRKNYYIPLPHNNVYNKTK